MKIYGVLFLILSVLFLGIKTVCFAAETVYINAVINNKAADVMNMLEKLQGINGKRVGIISNVEGLKERIPVQIKVSRIDQTRSMVEVVDNRI